MGGVVGMNRRKKLLKTAAVAVALVLFGTAPAVAGPGGTPTAGSCGLGKAGAHDAIQDQTSPGATENARIKPSEVGCPGKG